MVVILEEDDYQKWLQSPLEDNQSYIRAYPPECLTLFTQQVPEQGNLW